MLKEHRTTLAAAATTKLGRDCTAHGASECESGVCLHTGAEPNKGYFCSKVCGAQAECPPQWRCEQVHPNLQQRVCIPPENWAGAATHPNER